MTQRLTDILVARALITAEQLAACVAESRSSGEAVAALLVKRGYMRESALMTVLSELYGVPLVRIGDYTISRQILDLVPAPLARQYQVFPISLTDNALTVAVSDPLNVMAVDDLHMATRRKINVVLALPSEIRAALNSHYDSGSICPMESIASEPDGEFEDEVDIIRDARPAQNENVCFSITSPAQVRPGESFVIDVWAHLNAQRKEVIERAKDEAGGREIAVKSKGPFAVARGTVLLIALAIDGLVVAEPNDAILWDGEIANATFPVSVPANAKLGALAASVTIRVGGLQIGKIHFSIGVGAAQGTVGVLPVGERWHRQAFASYASPDRDAVLARVQGIEKAAPSLKVFLDVASLRSGSNWREEILRVIPTQDVFYLFWSANARDSEYVEMEWKCALQTRGAEFIDPVPLCSPKEVPPPMELASKHFNDWTLAYMNGTAG